MDIAADGRIDEVSSHTPLRGYSGNEYIVREEPIVSSHTPLRGYSALALKWEDIDFIVSSHTPLRGYSAFLHKKVMGFLCRMQNFSPLFCTSRVVSCKREVNIENYLAISCANLPGFCGRLGFAQWGQSIITPSCSRRNWRPRDSIRGFQLLPKR